MSRRHEAQIKNFIGAPGYRTQGRDVSPQYVSGMKNNAYVSPTYASNVFAGRAENTRQTRSRLRTTNRDNFGNEIYRETLYQSRSPMRNGRRSQRSTIEIRQRNEVDTQSLAQDSAPSVQQQPQPVIQPQQVSQQQDITPQAQTPQAQTPLPEPASYQQSQASIGQQAQQQTYQQSQGQDFQPIQSAQQQQLPTIGQQTQQLGAPAQDFYPRYDDEIFARTGFSPNKGKVIDNEKIPAIGDPKYSPEKPQDPTAVYEQDAKNQLIAIERRIDEKQDQVGVLQEEKAMLDDLINQEEAKRLESKLRRDYRKRIDHYHINLTDNKFYDEKVLRVTKTRGKAPGIHEEAARVENEKVAETLYIKEKKAQYKAELDKLAQENKRARESQRKTHYEAERMHKGLPIGERDNRRYGRNIMKTLRSQIQEKFNFRKKLDQLAQSSNLDDFMAYKDYLDGIQQQIQTQNKQRRDANAALTNSRHMGSGKKANRRRVTKQKKIDAVIVSNLAEHDNNVMAFEQAKKEALKTELKLGLEKQLQEKQAIRQTKAVVEHFEGQLVDPGIGSNSYRPARNYDQRPDIHLKGAIKTGEFVDEKITDREMVVKLDAFDKMKINEEIQINQEKKNYLANVLKEQMKSNEEKDF